MSGVQPSLDLLDEIFLRTRENAARAVGEDVLADAEVFLRWAGSNWIIELVPSHHIAEKFNIWLEKNRERRVEKFFARTVYGDFCHEFARWCPPIDRGMVPSQPNIHGKSYYHQSPESVVWLGPLVSFEDTSKTQAAREIFKKPKAVELLLLGFTGTQLQVIDTNVHTKAMATAFGKSMKFNDKLDAIQKRMKEKLKAGNLSKTEALSLTDRQNQLLKEKAKVNKDAHDAGRTLVPVLPFSAESLEELEMKFDLFFSLS